MENKFELVRGFLIDLGYHIESENPLHELFIINDESRGICNLVVDCEEPLLIFEQFIGNIQNETLENYKRLLQINRQLVHGAFVLDTDSNALFFRDTLELAEIDMNEVEGTLLALSFAMVEYGNELINICK